MLMQLAGKPMRKRTGIRTAALILSKSCSASRLMRLLGLFHGIVTFTPRTMQFCARLFADWLTSSTVHAFVMGTAVETAPKGISMVIAIQRARRRFVTNSVIFRNNNWPPS